MRAGSRDETSDVSGISHFLEHMVFKGTAARDALRVNADLDRIGAKHNAQTSEEDTVYYLACLPEYFGEAFDVLADILRPSLREEDFETEKRVILEEIQMYMDQPMSVAYEAARELHFRGHPLGRSILGTPESIGALPVSAMRGYFAERYGPSNIVLAVCGRGNWDDLVALAEARCGGWGGPTARRETPAARGTREFQLIHRADDLQQISFGIGDGPPLESSERYAAQLLSLVLGDYTGSRFYWELIEPGLVDTADFSYQDYNGAGAFFSFISSEPDAAEANLGRVAALLRGLAAHPVTEDELTAAKNKVMARAVVRAERPMGRLMSLGFHWAYRGEYLSLDQELDAFAAVTLADIARLIERWPLWPQTVVTVGPRESFARPE